MPLGLYISVPFCRTKCSYCNFASDVFSHALFQRYVERVGFDLDYAAETAASLGGQFEPVIDSIFLGGGTPTVLETDQFEALFAGIARNFEVRQGAEVTVECAPGTLTPGLLESFQRCGVNRVSLGVQSFVDQEASSVGRIHKAATVADDIRRLRECGITNINVDLIAGLPHQSAESWEFSVQQAIASSVPHVSVYMLEVDEDSRLGREVLAGGTRYHAHFVPDDDLTADFYAAACDWLNAAGVEQYEISNFARAGLESRHNLKYWTRQPYMGFGVDAHSMLRATGAKALLDRERIVGPKAHASTVAPAVRLDQNNHAKDAEEGNGFRRDVSWGDEKGFRSDGTEAIRFSTLDSLDAYLRGEPVLQAPVSQEAALEEAFFLGLRLNQGIRLESIGEHFGEKALASYSAVIAESVDAQLLTHMDGMLRLTPRGRLVSNEVFERFITLPAV